ncbi:MAG: TauD/TfdA family dioxygenase [Pseudomonadota bacterium]
MKITPNQTTLGAKIENIDLSRPVNQADFSAILRALGAHGVLWFPKQKLDAHSLKAFSERFGSLQGSPTGTYCEPGVPEVMLLSNIIEDGKPIGLADAGQDWHTDMSYNDLIGFVNVLYGIKIPRRNGKTLGNTVFADMHTAYDDLSPALKARLENMTATHDFNKFWEEMRRRPGSTRPPLTAEQRAQRPPSVHPIFLTHPITGRKVLYANPGYAIRINEMDEAESDAVLAELFQHQLQLKYQYAHEWTEGDVLMWDHIGTLHNAIPDYAPDEHRLIKRCQVMADRIFDPEFRRTEMMAAAAG